jgi:imidazolonepropionase-like amidohydrolase
MRGLGIACGVIAVCGWLAAARCGAQDSTAVAFVGVNVVDVEAGVVVSDRAVVVEGKTIREVVAAEEFAPAEGMTVVECDGKYLIPGLWDMHVHVIAPVPGALELYLANGVTGIRDLNSEDFLLGWRDEVRDGKRLGPRIVASGKYLDARLNGQPPDRVTADTPEDARKLVQARKAAGADFIKVYSGLSAEVFDAVIDEAKRLKLPVAGHCPERVTAFDAARLGQRSMEHLTGIAMSCARDEEKLRLELAKAFGGPHGYDIEEANKIVAMAMLQQDPEKQSQLFAEFKRFKTWQTPTLTAMRPLPTVEESATAPDPRLKFIHPGFTQLWTTLQGIEPLRAVRDEQFQFAKPTVCAMHEAGVPMLLGTDSGGAMNAFIFPGFAVAEEMELLVACGLAPADALRAATLNPAMYFDDVANSGTVAAGKRADLVLLDANPLETIGNLRKISGVMAAGRWLPREELDRMLAETARQIAGAGR